MSYEKTKLMNLEDGQTLLGAIDGKMSDLKSAVDQTKADVITVNDSASSAIKSFPDGANDQPMAVQIAVEPVQDLHGYDNPWPGGGGKNLLDPTKVTTGKKLTNVGELTDSTGWAVSDWIPCLPNTDYEVRAAINSASGYAFCFYDSEKNFLRNAVQSGTAPVDSIKNSGEDSAYLRVTVTATDTSSKAAVIQTSTWEAFAPYSNICPISGWTGAKLTRTGKNLCALPVVAASQVSINVSNCFFIKAGTYKIQLTNPKNCTSARMCIVMLDSAGNKLLDLAHRPNGAFSSTGNYWRIGNDENFPMGLTITIVEDCYVRFMIGVGNVGSSSTADGMLVQGNQYEAYEPYTGNNYNITFPSEAGTVYGGTLTVNKDGTGELVVDRACVSITSSTTRDGLRINTNQVCAANYELTRFGISVDGDRTKDILSNSLGIYTPSNIYNYGTPNTCGLSNNNKHVYVMSTTSITNAEEFEAWMDSIGTVQVCFYLAEETIIPLTNLEVIETLKGLNNVWADTGDILSVDYSADTKLYVDQVTDKLTAAQRLMELIITTNREDSMTASKAYSQGNLMIVNGALYKATTAIAKGATLTVDTNIKATTVADELASLA